MAPRYKWTPLQQATPLPFPEAAIADQMRIYKMTREQVLAMVEEQHRNTTLWINDVYQVAVRPLEGDYEGFIHLNIRRRDGGPILRDWRHFQQIKNELVGPECEAVELYPAESRKVDASNKFHLFVANDPNFRFPFGDLFGNVRDVQYESGSTPGARQRPE